MKPHRGTLILVFGILGIAIAGCALGQRLMHMEVYQNEQLILRTMFSGPDSESPAALWKHAGREPATSDEKVAQVKADEGRPLHARLTGSIRIKILHGDQVMTSASLQDLELVRRAPDSPGWYLPEKEVQRAKRAAGF